jgi:maltooligosyltrehalose trehalohydrolase
VTAVHSQVQHQHAYLTASQAPGRCLGANWSDDRCEFTIWAPFAKRLALRFEREDRIIELEPSGQGYFQADTQNLEPNSLYLVQLDDRSPRGDPASRFQPKGVFGPSGIFDASAFRWSDEKWRGLNLESYILYELHVGTYTRSGTFDALCERLPYLKSLGVTAIEIMPVAQFPGARNWGYDGVFPFAVQNSYGGPVALQRFVDACHREGFAVVLDVVYNHLGPEGNFLGEFGPYFTDRYQTPWGKAINFDGPNSDHVVRYFIENALYWVERFHIDALRLDAIHGIFDRNARPFLSLLSAAIDDLAQRYDRKIYLIAESDLNDPTFVQRREDRGYGLHAQWNDDFHHSLHALQTGERNGYYSDFGSLSHMRAAFQNGYVYSGQYSSFRQHRHGASPADLKRSQLVVFSQNHDQVGNRGWGERTSALIDFERQKLSAGAVLLSPFLPLLFMGEEYGETAPFLYFTEHSDPGLAKAVRDGRRAEFAGFHGEDEVVPDPQEEGTFLKSKLDQDVAHQGNHKLLLDFYRELLRIRKERTAIADMDLTVIDSSIQGNCLLVTSTHPKQESMLVFNFAKTEATFSFPVSNGTWSKFIDSAEQQWGGPGSSVPPSVGQDLDRKITLPPASFCGFERSMVMQKDLSLGGTND